MLEKSSHSLNGKCTSVIFPGHHFFLIKKKLRYNLYTVKNTMIFSAEFSWFWQMHIYLYNPPTHQDIHFYCPRKFPHARSSPQATTVLIFITIDEIFPILERQIPESYRMYSCVSSPFTQYICEVYLCYCAVVCSFMLLGIFHCMNTITICWSILLGCFLVLAAMHVLMPVSLWTYVPFLLDKYQEMKFMGPLINFWHIGSLIFIYWVLITNSAFILSFVHVLLEYFYGFTFKFYIHIEVKSIILSIFYTMDCRYYLQLAFFTHTILMMFLLI